MTIEKTLAERGHRYGPFLEKAKTVQALIDVVIHEPGWERLAADQKQCIMVCFDKFARAIHGDPNHRDNFHDVVGYAKLVDDRMAADEAAEIADIERAIDEDAAALKRSIDHAEGWKVWTGGERPGTAETKFDLRTRNGQQLFGVMTGENSWRHSGHEHDIVSYRHT